MLIQWFSVAPTDCEDSVAREVAESLTTGITLCLVPRAISCSAQVSLSFSLMCFLRCETIRLCAAVTTGLSPATKLAKSNITAVFRFQAMICAIETHQCC